MFQLDGKVAMITGAAQGQGEAEARLFAELGARVVVADILDDKGRTVAADIGAAALYVPSTSRMRRTGLRRYRRPRHRSGQSASWSTMRESSLVDGWRTPDSTITCGSSW